MESDQASQSPGRGGGPQSGEPGQGRGRLQGPEEAPVEARGLVCEVKITVSASGDGWGKEVMCVRVRTSEHVCRGCVCKSECGCACVSMNLLQPSVLHKPSPIHHGSQKPSVIVPILKPRKLRYREEWTCQRSQTSKQVSTQACLAPRCPLEPELLFRYQPQICRASHHVPQKTLQDPSQRPS